MAKKINFNNIEAVAKKNAAEADKRRIQQIKEERAKQQEAKSRPTPIINPIIALLIADAILYEAKNK